MSPSSLREYAAKRDFSRTPEPRARGRKQPEHSLQFVVQKHAARRLHYDLRLELGGTLKSWAVTRGPSLVPGEKRLAVHVEDHPLEYATFEGTIPEGEYGAGQVIVWDRGTWTPEGDPRKGYAKGHLTFTLDGTKLKGRWHLVRMRRRAREKQDPWLLIKSEDDAARNAEDPDVLAQAPTSVISHKTIEAIAKQGSSIPRFIEPCLATISAKAPRGENWVHEIKFDGYRIQVRKRGSDVRMLTRRGLDWTEKFGTLATAFRSIRAKDALIDGELVVEEDSGASSFGALQEALKTARYADLRYYAFDLLFRDGHDLRGLPLDQRKRQLAEVLSGLPDDGPIRFSEDFHTDGDILLGYVCRMGLEGVVSKRSDRSYRSGRSKDWVKTKCMERQEFVVVGFSPSTTARRAIGALAIGQYDGGALVYRGRVGTGFDEDAARNLFQVLDPLRRSTSPLAKAPASEAKRPIRWVEPKVVVEVEFRSWTGGGLIRHAVFRGLREDKPASEVVTERPAESASPPMRAFDDKILTHPERLFWPEAGITKLGLAEFYAAIWEWVGAQITDRPLSLLRCPEGHQANCFFQKHAWAGIGKAIRRCRPTGDGKDVLYIKDLDGAVALVQAGVLEIHPWGCKVDNVEQPDRLIFDLDPGPGVQWSEVVAAALSVRELLADTGLETFVKTSGGKGLHVVAPLRPAADWSAVKGFAESVARHMARQHPDRFIATATKRKREGLIFVDYLRNSRGATAVAAYSTRARAGAPVSTPLSWEELGDVAGPAQFTVLNLEARLRHLAADPWKDLNKRSQPLPRPLGTENRRSSGRAPSKKGT